MTTPIDSFAFFEVLRLFARRYDNKTGDKLYVFTSEICVGGDELIELVN